MDFEELPYCPECGSEATDTLNEWSEIVDGVDCQCWEYHCRCCLNVWTEYVAAVEIKNYYDVRKA